MHGRSMNTEIVFRLQESFEIHSVGLMTMDFSDREEAIGFNFDFEGEIAKKINKVIEERVNARIKELGKD